MFRIGRAASLLPGLHSGLREGAGNSLGLCAGAGIPTKEAAPDGFGAARLGGDATFLFGVLWIALLAAELTIAYELLKAQIRHR